MVIPICKEKYKSKSIRTPENFENYRRKIKRWPRFKAPESVIICFDDRIMKYIEKKHDIKKYRAFVGDFWILKDTNNKVSVFGNFGLGSAITAQRVEELIQFGIKKIILIGEAGGISKKLNIGDIVVCNKALRDEGVSYHYLKAEKFVNSSKKIQKKITSYLNKERIKYFSGATWTTDAIYRQTIAEVKKHQKENILTADMEAAAVFAVAKYREIDAGAIFVVSDSFKNLKWNPQFHNTEKKLEKVFEIAKEVLS